MSGNISAQTNISATALGGTPSNISNATTTASQGSSTAVARADHVHGFTAITLQSLGIATLPTSNPGNYYLAGDLSWKVYNPAPSCSAHCGVTSSCPSHAGCTCVGHYGYSCPSVTAQLRPSQFKYSKINTLQQLVFIRFFGDHFA